MDSELDVALFHWAPATKRSRIESYGLRPGQVPVITTPGWRAPYICFAETPSWAWGLSGGMRNAPPGEWDLWQVHLSNLVDPVFIETYDHHRWHEVRTAHRVWKRHVWYVGSRVSMARSQART